MITAEDVKARADLRTVMHARLSKGGYFYQYQSRQWPELTLTARAETRQGPVIRKAFVGETEVDLWDFARIAQLLNERDAERTAA